MPFAVAVIGAGNIAAGFDSPGDANILTHLHAITADPRFQCVGLYDLDRAKAQNEALRWSVPPAVSIDRLFAKAVDLVVVAVPDAAHAACLRDVLRHRPRAVLCEKPLATDLATGRALVEAYAGEKVPLAVNYQRRYEATAIALKQAFERGDLGRAVAGAVWYSKGILHNGSHAVDFLRFLFGEVREASLRRQTVDFREDDPTVTGTLVFDAAAIELIGGDERLFSLFEIDLLFERARYRYLLSGARLERYETRPDPLFPGYVEMTRVEEIATGLNRALCGCYAALAAFLDGSAPLANSARDALATQEVCAALQSLPAGASWRPPGR